MSAIAELVALLISNGCSADVVRQSVDLAETHAAMASERTAAIVRQSADVGGLSSDSSTERRRAYDRKRQAEIRRLKRLSEKPPLILTSLSSSEEILKKERKKESSGIRARARLVPIPDDWKPSQHAFEVAEKHGSSVSDTEPIFRDYLKSSGKRYADYDAAFYNFLRNQRKFNGNGPSKTPSGGSLIASIDRELSELRGEKSANFELPEGNIRRLSYGPIR